MGINFCECVAIVLMVLRHCRVPIEQLRKLKVRRRGQMCGGDWPISILQKAVYVLVLNELLTAVCRFLRNTATRGPGAGGGIYTFGTSSSTFKNITLANNTAASGGAGVYLVRCCCCAHPAGPKIVACRSCFCTLHKLVHLPLGAIYVLS